MGIGVSNWRAGFCRCSLPVKNRYWGGQWKVVFSICALWWNLKRCLVLFTQKAICIHSCFMNVPKKFLTALAEGKSSKELTGRLVLLSKLCHSFLIIWNLYLHCVAQHDEYSQTGNFLGIKLLLFSLTRSPEESESRVPLGTQEPLLGLGASQRPAVPPADPQPAPRITFADSLHSFR